MICVIIFHKDAGGGLGEKVAFELFRYLNCTCSWEIKGPFKTRFRGDARKNLTPFWAPKADLIIVVGGDGTLREVVSGLKGAASKVTIGFIPMGNANVIARELHIPLNVMGAMETIIKGKPRHLDVGIMRSFSKPRLFLSMIEVGVGARIVHRVHKMRYGILGRMYKRFGDLMYLTAGCAAVIGKAAIPFSMQVEEQAPCEGLTAAVISNTQTYAKKWSFSPRALMDDGILNYYARDRDDPISLFHTYHSASKKRHQRHDFAVSGAGTRFSIASSSAPLYIQMDGDPVPRLKEIDVEIKPHYFKMICPCSK